MRVHSPSERLLHHASEGQLFAHGRYQRDNEQVEEHTAESAHIQHLLGEDLRRFLQGFHVVFEPLEGRTEVHAFIPCGQGGGNKNGNEHQKHADEKKPPRRDVAKTQCLHGPFLARDEVIHDGRHNEQHHRADALPDFRTHVA